MGKPNLGGAVTDWEQIYGRFWGSTAWVSRMLGGARWFKRARARLAADGLDALARWVQS